MEFYENQIFHVFNQGNNKDAVFFNTGNYNYFLIKMKQFILPHADFLAYCLMPNHFHFLLYIHSVNISRKNDKIQSLNKSLGIMLSSYTNAVNNQQMRTGSLFRQHTKINDGWIEDPITSNSRFEKYIFSPSNAYGSQCFNYIHNNPVKAGLVDEPIEWPFSSFREFYSNSENPLCNIELAKELLVV